MEYRTSDLNLSAFLRTKYNLKIKRLEPDQADRDRALFVFLYDEDFNIEKIISDYFNKDDECSASKYMAALSDLRTWLRNFKMNRE
jgi:hypothetical protein